MLHTMIDILLLLYYVYQKKKKNGFVLIFLDLFKLLSVYFNFIVVIYYECNYMAFILLNNVLYYTWFYNL